MSLLQEDQLKGQNGIVKFIIDNMFTHKLNYHIKKHKLLVRKIVGKMIRRVGVTFVTRTMPESHRPMIAYMEREKRKKMNKKEKERLLALMGTVTKTEEGAKEDEDDSSESSDDDQDKQEEVDSEEELDDLDDDYGGARGND
jgi:hypothetical protein